MILPRIHLGGTPRSMLHADYARALEAAYEAVKAFDFVYMNQRDYPEDWGRAVDQRAAAREHLVKALTYLEMHVEHTADQLQ